MARTEYLQLKRGLKIENPGFLSVISFLRHMRELEPIRPDDLSEKLGIKQDRVRLYVNFCAAHDLLQIPRSGMWSHYSNNELKLSRRGRDLLLTLESLDYRT